MVDGEPTVWSASLLDGSNQVVSADLSCSVDAPDEGVVDELGHSAAGLSTAELRVALAVRCGLP